MHVDSYGNPVETEPEEIIGRIGGRCTCHAIECYNGEEGHGGGRCENTATIWIEYDLGDEYERIAQCKPCGDHHIDTQSRGEVWLGPAVQTGDDHEN